MDKEKIEYWRKAGSGLSDDEWNELCGLAIKGLESGNTAAKDVTGLIEALGHQKQCDEDGVECIVSRQAVDEAIIILKGLEQPDADSARLAETIKGRIYGAGSAFNDSQEWESERVEPDNPDSPTYLAWIESAIDDLAKFKQPAPDSASIGCALEQAAATCFAMSEEILSRDKLPNAINPLLCHEVLGMKACAAAIRSLNEPALKAWEGMKADAERYRWLRDDKRDVEINVLTMNAVCENALDAYIDAERAKAAT